MNANLLIDWHETYRVICGGENCFSSPDNFEYPAPKGFWSIPILLPNICNMVVEALRFLDFTVFSYYKDVDGTLVNEPQTPYVVAVPCAFEAIESEEGLAGKSTDALKEAEHKGVSLPASLLLKLGCIVSFNVQTDSMGVTLCTGSVSKDGLVPGLYWNMHDRRVLIPWYKPNVNGSRIRSRSMRVVANRGEALLTTQ